MTQNRTDTLTWVGMVLTTPGRYLVVRDFLDQREVLGEVWSETRERWRAQRVGEPMFSLSFRRRRDAAMLVARIEAPRSGGGVE